MKKKKPLENPWIQFLIAFLIFYLLILVFFRAVVFESKNLALSPDFLSGIILNQTSVELAEQGPPLWSPYYFGGMPCMAALFHPNYTYTFFNWGLGQWLLSILFVNPAILPVIRLMLFHLLMAGCFAYLLGRSLGFSWLVSIFAGLVYMFAPQLIVLPNVGHGSKIFTAAYLPLVLLAAKKLIEERKLVYFALMSLAVGMMLLALHVQVAFYGLLAAGMFLVWSVIGDIKKQPGRIPLKVVVFALAVVVGLGFAASIYLPLYEYSDYSMRGGVEGGLDWEYATNWSFHPLETLTYVIPSFFGFGGESYWGYMPFTDYPHYWGAAALIFAILAAVFARNRMVWFFIILLIFVWIVSFGKFFPLLFKPMFQFMPYFKKFRVPVMIQILMLLSAAALSGYGLEKMRELRESAKSFRWLTYAAGILLGVAVLATILHSPLQKAVSGWISVNHPQIPYTAHGRLFNLTFGDLWKTVIFALAALGALRLFLKKKIGFNLLVIFTAVILIIDLWVVNSHLISTTPRSHFQSMLRPTPAVNFLQKQEGYFRIYPLDRFRPQNWYGLFGLESASGYLGTKMKRMQEALDNVGGDNFNFINMLNARYLLLDREVSHPMLELVMDGQQKVYLNKAALPRCWLVHKLAHIPDEKERYQYMKTFDPRNEAIVEEEVPLPFGIGGESQIISHHPLEVKVRTSCETPSYLVLSEIHYPPYWTAAVDGKRAEIHPTNHILRGVVVPAGEHEVVFKCQSAVYRLGWIVHWIVLAGLSAVFALHFIPWAIAQVWRK